MQLKRSVKDYFNMGHTAMGIDLTNWFHLLWKNKFAVGLPYWPKALFITGNATLNLPIQVWERLRFSGKIGKTEIQEPVFILGYQRSGTTFLHYVMSKDPNFAFCNNTQAVIPHIFISAGGVMQKMLQSAMPEKRPQDNVKLGAHLPAEEEFPLGSFSRASWVHGLYFPRSLDRVVDEYVTFAKGHPQIKKHWQERFDLFLRKLTYVNPGKKLLLKSPPNTSRVKEILELYPNAKFIHIHRDPYAVYLSNEKLYESVLPHLALQWTTTEKIQDHILYAYETSYRKYLADRALLRDDQLIEFSYSDFVANPIDQLRVVYQKLKLEGFENALPLFETELKSTEGYTTNRFPKMEESVKKKIVDRWGFAFEAFGYKP
jgi:hypothetical protein